MSSGNLTADRRFAYARMLHESGDAVAAAEVIAQALELVPNWAEGRFALGEAHVAAGHVPAAISEYRIYLTLDPSDSMGAIARLALLQAAAPPPELPHAYVARLFDEYAPRFDRSLVDRLLYRAPQAIANALDELYPYRNFTRALDLGCGTGLAGAVLRSRVKWLEGVDLSPGMISYARQKTIYDHLAVGSLEAYLTARGSCFDLIVAADVFVYCGVLGPVFAAVRSRLAADGVFAFSLQRSDSGDFVLGSEQRFSHSRTYVSACAGEAGFSVVRLQDGVFRTEKSADVPGLLAILRPMRA
jgi:predicted TPR repeat methyltransferase